MHFTVGVIKMHLFGRHRVTAVALPVMANPSLCVWLPASALAVFEHNISERPTILVPCLP